MKRIGTLHSFASMTACCEGVEGGPLASFRGSLPLPPEHGIHKWTLEVAWACRKAGLPADDAARIITSYDDTLRRPLQPREAHNAVERAYSTTLVGVYRAKPRRQIEWLPSESARLHELIQAAEVDLWTRSPIRPDQDLSISDILVVLFPDPAGLICIGKSCRQFCTAPLIEHRELESAQLIVPAYMTERYGFTLDGKRSMHSKANTGARRFMVCDFDGPPPEQHPSIILKLSEFREPVLVVHSGGKSLHAWFPVTGDPVDDDLFWRTAIRLGADPALWRNSSSFVRLPLGTRDNGKIQRVLYFNPTAAAR